MNKINQRTKNALRFYVLANKLKYKIRAGWDDTHWNIPNEKREHVAEHTFGTLMLAIGIDSEFDVKVDLDKVLKMLALHDIGEAFIPDITPFEGISKEEKKIMEHNAILEMTDGLIKQEELASLIFEFDERKSKEAIFAYHCDKLEADLQSKIYQDMGLHNSLDNQQNNVVFKSERALQMVRDGAKTAFDIWYEWDRTIYEDDENFAAILELAKITNINSIK